MQLWIHTHDNKIHNHTFHQTDSVSSLQETFKSMDSLILYNNQVLLPTMPLGFYNIASGSHVYLVPQINRSQRKPGFSATQVADLKKEVERIKDIMYSKIDSTPKYFGKIVKRFNGIKRPNEISVNDMPFAVPSSINSPSSTALPKFW